MLLETGEWHAVAGWDCVEAADGAMLCCMTVCGIKLCSDSVDLNDSLRNCLT